MIPKPEYCAILHAGLLVSSTERALRFYRDVLGFVVDTSRPDLGFPGAWLQTGAQQIHLLELANPDPISGRPAHAGRDRHIAISVRDIDTVRAALDNAGATYTWSKSGRRAIFCRDPEGNGLEFVENVADSTG